MGESVTLCPADAVPDLQMKAFPVGPNHIVQIVNSRMAIFTKTGKVVYGAVVTNSIFKGFGGPCESTSSTGSSASRSSLMAVRSSSTPTPFGLRARGFNAASTISGTMVVRAQ